MSYRSRNGVRKTSALLLSGLVICCIPFKDCGAEWSEWIADAEVAYATNDNINNTFFDSARQSDQTWSLLASLGRIYQLSHSTRIQTSLDVGGGIHDEFDQLDHFDLGFRLAIRHKFGLGGFQPWAAASISSTHIFSRSVIRNGQLATARLELGKRLHERLDLVIHYSFDYRNSTSGGAIASSRLIQSGIDPNISKSVYDLNGQSLGTGLNWLASEQLLLSLGYTYRDGDVVSSNEPALVPSVAKIIDAVSMDDALPGWAYRFNANTHIYSLDANYAVFGGHASVNLGYRHTESDSDNFVYRNDVFRVSFIYSF